jgi:short-subunit dehydrogenase
VGIHRVYSPVMEPRRPLNVLITGATRGIGRFLALDLAKKGCRVIASGRSRAAVESLADEAREAGLDLEGIILDVADPGSIAAAEKAVHQKTEGRGPDVLINNAGYGQAGPILELSDANLRDQFETNVFGLMAVTRAFVPAMIDRGSGTVINVSSTGGRLTFPFFGAYHASKYAVEALSDALRIELSPFGVRVAIIEPGPVRSSFAERAMQSLPADGGKSSRWAPVLARAEAIRVRSDRLAVGPELVARAVKHAIESRRPRARYLVPALRFRLLFALLALTPTCVLDAFYACVLGMRGGRPGSLGAGLAREGGAR